MPYGTDSLETARIAAEAAEKAWKRGAKLMVLPTIPLGIQNMGQIELPFCLHTSLITQKFILQDILKALHQQGFRKFVLMNGHGGNDFKQMVRDLATPFPRYVYFGGRMVQNAQSIELFRGKWRPCQRDGNQYYHALFSQFGLPLEEAGEGKAKSFKLKSLQNKTAWTPRRWNKVSEDTGVGNPKKATAEKGKKFLDDTTSKIADYFVELAECDLEDLYE